MIRSRSSFFDATIPWALRCWRIDRSAGPDVVSDPGNVEKEKRYEKKSKQDDRAYLGARYHLPRYDICGHDGPGEVLGGRERERKCKV